MSEASSFRRRLAYLRRKAHLTQEGLAEKADLSRNYIGLLESGQRRPSLQTVFQIQKALNVKVHDLVIDMPSEPVVAEQSSVYGKDPSSPGGSPLTSREYERLLRRLQKCTPEEIGAISKILNQVLKFKGREKKKTRAKRPT